MSTRRPRVLFISHAASRNGATILLLSFLRWLKDRVDWDIQVLVQGRGPLLDEFRMIAKTTVWRDPGPKLDILLPRVLKPFKHALQMTHTWLSRPSGQFDLIYANTTAAAPIVYQLTGKTRSLLWHVHELSYAIKISLTQHNWMDCFYSAGRFIAVSNAVRDALIADQGIDADLIDVINGFIEPQSVSPDIVEVKRWQLRRELCIPPDGFVIGACGSLGWRKGSDIFLQMAHRVAAKLDREDIFFLWVGGAQDESAALEFEHDRIRLGLAHLCRFVPTTADVRDYYYVMDAFALTSREDPFPLVVLEAADHALPILCFDNAGGAVEFIGDDSGLRVPYLDVEVFVDCIIKLYRDRTHARQLGTQARLKAHESLRVETQGPKLLQSMQRCLADNGYAECIGNGLIHHQGSSFRAH
jgi:glycosyltransferase involved in cell wall biosynthesis